MVPGSPEPGGYLSLQPTWGWFNLQAQRSMLSIWEVPKAGNREPQNSTEMPKRPEINCQKDQHSCSSCFVHEHFDGINRKINEMRWLDSITDSTDMNLSKPQETVKEREAWHATVHTVAKSRTQLSDWTTTIEKPLFFSEYILSSVKWTQTTSSWDCQDD